MDRSCYIANDLLDDLAGASDPAEIHAIGVMLYVHAFDHHRRMNGRWTAAGKHIVRVLRHEEGVLGEAYLSAFDKLFSKEDPTDVIRIIADIYARSGGLLAEWRCDTLSQSIGVSLTRFGKGWPRGDERSSQALLEEARCASRRLVSPGRSAHAVLTITSKALERIKRSADRSRPRPAA